MQLPILIEPLATGRYVARAGDPFAATAEGATVEEAVRELESLLRARLQAGPRVAVIDLPNGSGQGTTPAEAILEEEWFFQTLQEEIEKNRQRESEADR